MAPFRLDRDERWLEIGSHGRTGPGQRLSLAQIEQIRSHGHTCTRSDGQSIGRQRASTGCGTNAHFNYISRKGELEIETDDGERLIGDEAGQRSPLNQPEC